MKIYLKEQKLTGGRSCHHNCYWFGKLKECFKLKSPYGCKSKYIYLLEVDNPFPERTVYNCIIKSFGFDSRDCKYRDYDEYNFAECIINNKRKPCLKKECPKFK